MQQVASRTLPGWSWQADTRTCSAGPAAQTCGAACCDAAKDEACVFDYDTYEVGVPALTLASARAALAVVRI